MLAELFYKLREFQVPVSVTEYLTLLSAMEKGISGLNIDSFYFLARSALVKDERFFDRFDIVLEIISKGRRRYSKKSLEKYHSNGYRPRKLNLSDEEKKQIESMGGWDKLMETLKKRRRTKKSARGGSKMIGTGGTCPLERKGTTPKE